MGNNEGRFSEEGSDPEQSKWTYEDGQVYYDGLPWPPRNTVSRETQTELSGDNRHFAAVRKPTVSRETQTELSGDNRHQGGNNGLMVESRVNVKRIKRIIVDKISTGGRAIITTEDEIVVKGPRGRPRKKSKTCLEPMVDEAEPIIIEVDDPNNDHEEKEKNTNEATKDIDKFSEDDHDDDEGMPRNYGMSSGAESSPSSSGSDRSSESSSDSSSSDSDEDSDVTERKKGIVEEKIRYEPGWFLKKCNLTAETYMEAVADKVEFYKKKLTLLQCKFDCDLVDECKTFLMSEYPVALRRFKMRGSLEIQMLLIKAYIKHKLDKLEGKAKKEAVSLYIMTADSKPLPTKRIRKQEPNQLDRGYVKKNRTPLTPKNSKDLKPTSVRSANLKTSDSSLKRKFSSSSEDDSMPKSGFQDGGLQTPGENLSDDFDSSSSDSSESSPVRAQSTSYSRQSNTPYWANTSSNDDGKTALMMKSIKKEVIENDDGGPSMPSLQYMDTTQNLSNTTIPIPGSQVTTPKNQRCTIIPAIPRSHATSPKTPRNQSFTPKSSAGTPLPPTIKNQDVTPVTPKNGAATAYTPKDQPVTPKNKPCTPHTPKNPVFTPKNQAGTSTTPVHDPRKRHLKR